MKIYAVLSYFDFVSTFLKKKMSLIVSPKYFGIQGGLSLKVGISGYWHFGVFWDNM